MQFDNAANLDSKSGGSPISAKISRFGQWSTFNMDSGV